MTMPSSKLKKGTYFEFGNYGRSTPQPILWRVAKPQPKGAVLLIADGVLMAKAFDAQGPAAPTAGDNRWRDSTLRHWLNSDAAFGRVDFGPHPVPAAARLHTALDVGAKAGLPKKPKTDNAYDHEQGFLRYFSDGERSLIVPVELETEVLAGYDDKRKKGIDRTTDKAFVLTWDEYKKLPSELKGGIPAPQLREDRPEWIQPKVAHWSRTPLAGLGAAVLDLWWKDKARANSGPYCTWGVRPCIAVRDDIAFTGTGTKKNPFRIAAGT
jgi:hypothetical protein